jgi:16S rRNA (guanine966-N2)-methyltransferase
VRETVFNWLGGALQGAHCLDLFAGTGVLGLEALSRGASTALLVERDAELARALRARIAELDADAAVVQRNVEALLREPPPRLFDIVFLDPPYSVAVEPLLAQIQAWIADRALIYVERPRADGTSPGIDGLAAALDSAELVKSSRAGGVAFGLLEVRRS